MSLALHTSALAVGLVAASSSSKQRIESPDSPKTKRPGDALDLPGVTEVTLFGESAAPAVAEPEPTRGATTAHLDMARGGHGGDVAADRVATNFADKNDNLSRTTDMRSHQVYDQVQRLRTGDARQSWEDRRSTLAPMELTFLATGKGTFDDRRPVAATNPSLGARPTRLAVAEGGIANGSSRPERGDEPYARETPSQAGMPAPILGQGVRASEPGHEHRESAAIASVRPLVPQAPPAVQAPGPGRPHDTTDTEQQVSDTLNSIVHASTMGGATGSGRGGSGGGGTPGFGGSNDDGSRTRALGPLEGDGFDINTRDPRLSPYFRRIRSKIEPHTANAFPREAALELKQGTVIVTFTVRADGGTQVQWPPLRPSGIDEFDKNIADAVRKAAPFPPIPPELGRGSLTIRFPYTVKNPIVR